MKHSRTQFHQPRRLYEVGFLTRFLCLFLPTSHLSEAIFDILKSYKTPNYSLPSLFQASGSKKRARDERRLVRNRRGRPLLPGLDFRRPLVSSCGLLSRTAGGNRAYLLPDPARTAPAFLIVPTDREPGTSHIFAFLTTSMPLFRL